MEIYAHRARFEGSEKEENSQEAIHACLEQGIGVEVDVWGVDGEMWLGHDGPKQKVGVKLLQEKRVICHAKNVEAVVMLRDARAVFFCLERDSFALCSNGLIWANYGTRPTPLSIMCSPELVGSSEQIALFYERVAGGCYGICTDYPLKYGNFELQ